MGFVKQIVLGARLQAVAEHVPNGAKIADIGTDHAYLPIYLVQTGKVTKAIGIEVHEGPYLSALNTVNSYGLTSHIEIRRGDGLKPLSEGEVDTLILAGMGGNTILEILAARPEITRRVERIIVQPQGAQGKLRQELLFQGWLLRDERLVIDDGRLYTVICFSRTEGTDRGKIEHFMDSLLDELESVAGSETVKRLERETAKSYFWQLGPICLQRRDVHLADYLREIIRELELRIEQMQFSRRPEVQRERQILIGEKRYLEGLRVWLSQSV